MIRRANTMKIFFQFIFFSILVVSYFPRLLRRVIVKMVVLEESAVTTAKKNKSSELFFTITTVDVVVWCNGNASQLAKNFIGVIYELLIAK